MKPARLGVAVFVPLLSGIALAACSSIWGSGGGVRVAVSRIAVLPIERLDPSTAVELAELAEPSAGGDVEAPRLAAGAEKIVTAEIYGVLANQSRFHLVPDLAVTDALASLPAGVSLEERARALGRETDAEAVLCGRVWRYVDRIGTDLGVTQAASVAFELKLVLTSTGEVVWWDKFNQTQEPLSSNLFNWWMFWRGGPRWFTARQLTSLGVERLFERMEDKVG